MSLAGGEVSGAVLLTQLCSAAAICVAGWLVPSPAAGQVPRSGTWKQCCSIDLFLRSAASSQQMRRQMSCRLISDQQKQQEEEDVVVVDRRQSLLSLQPRRRDIGCELLMIKNLQCRLEETMLGIIRHDNIVVLRGSIQSDDDDGTVQLVYEHMENGCCLHEWLHGNHRSQLEAGESRQYATAQVNEKVDVYSFGVVLLSSSREDWVTSQA
uniref:Protein kinase domain-containing protein n=1 Tax=Oryza barthii TaxID=65489 RepID=A0A0D3F2Q6_9ORYZ